MKAELLKRFFRAIASSDQEAIQKLTTIVIEEERNKGHTLLAEQLENIAKKGQKETRNSSSQSNRRERESSKSYSKNLLDPGTAPNSKEASLPTPENLQTLSELPISARFNLPLVTRIPLEKLRHHMILPDKIEARFCRIEREYAARDRLAHYGLRYRQKLCFTALQVVEKH